MVTANDKALGRVVLSDIMMMVKKMAWLMVVALLKSVARIPDAAPLCSGGTLFMMDAALGERKIPVPMPKTNSIKPKDK